MRSLIRRYIRFVKRLIAWLPIIWRDEDWDPAYLYEIMRFKISRMRLNIEQNARHYGWERNVKDMKVVEELLNRAAFSEFHWDNYVKCMDDRCYCGGVYNRTIYFRLPNGLTEVKYNRCNYCSWLIRKWDQQKQDADFNHAMEMIRKRSKGWWD